MREGGQTHNDYVYFTSGIIKCLLLILIIPISDIHRI